MKTFSFVLSVMILSLSLGACGGTNGDTTSPDATKETVSETSSTPNIPAESSDEYDLNMKNAKLNLDLVE